MEYKARNGKIYNVQILDFSDGITVIVNGHKMHYDKEMVRGVETEFLLLSESRPGNRPYNVLDHLLSELVIPDYDEDVVSDKVLAGV